MILSLGLFLLIDPTRLENFFVPIVILLICIFLTYIISYIYKRYILIKNKDKDYQSIDNY
jgi:hypothetical protein